MSTTTATVTSPGRALLDTARALLPAELFLDILALCETSSHLPAACRACSSDFFSPGQLPHRIWSHRHIFLNPEYDPQSARRNDGPLSGPSDPPRDPWAPSDINELHPRVAQIQSRLGLYLKARVPVPVAASSASGGGYTHPYAAGIAPPEPDPESTAAASVLSAGFIDWLFSKAGPFGSSAAAGHDELDVVVELRKQRKLELDKDAYMSGEDDEFEDAFDYANGFGSEDDEVVADRLDRDAAKWRLVPDALLLAHFFIRTTQLDLLEQTLGHLRTAIPPIASASAPISVWSFCMLDNRTHLRNELSELAIPSDESPISYPTFLCFLALFDWSKPALDVILRVFSDSINLPWDLAWIHSNPPMFSGMLETLNLLTSPPSTSARVLDILDLHYRIFSDVLLRYDLPNVPRSRDECRQSWIGQAIVDWVLKGHADAKLVDVALEYDLLDVCRARQLRAFVESLGDEELVAKLVAIKI